MGIPSAIWPEPPAAPLRLSWGDLDDAPDPYGPDSTVFGAWRPSGTVEPQAIREFRCCSVLGRGMTCWRCGGNG